MLLVLATLVALALHVLLGWQWSIVGGVIAGFGINRFGWALGAAAVSVSWLLLVVYNFAVAPAEMARFVEVTSGLLGNMPGPMLVVTTVLLGTVLGLSGGLMGALARSIVNIISRRGAAHPPESGEPAPHAEIIEE